MDNTSFKNSLFGGFNRQDVIDYIEQSSKKSNETISALQAENESLQNELTALKEENAKMESELKSLHNALAALQEERNSLSSSLSDEKRAKETAAAALLEANAQLAILQQELNEVRPQAEEYAKVKDHVSGIEFDAKRRADEVEASVRTRLTALLTTCQEQYSTVQSSAGTVVAHVSSELRKLEVALSQLPLSFDATKNEIDKLEKIVYDSENK